MIRIYLILFLIVINLKLISQQAYTWSGYSAGAATYTCAITSPVTNSMNVSYTEQANYRANVFQAAGSNTCAGVNITCPTAPYYNNVNVAFVNDYNTGTCICNGSNAQKGLVLAANYPNDVLHWEQINIHFEIPVCAPVTFSLWDINQLYYDDGTKWSYFTDKVDVSALDGSSVSVPSANIVITGCASTKSTSGKC